MCLRRFVASVLEMEEAGDIQPMIARQIKPTPAPQQTFQLRRQSDLQRLS